jgi:hypothetical protein
MTSSSELTPAPPALALFTPTPKAAKRVQEFFTAWAAPAETGLLQPRPATRGAVAAKLWRSNSCQPRRQQSRHSRGPGDPGRARQFNGCRCVEEIAMTQ